MEDKIEFLSPIPEKINEYLSQLPEDWDILFDSDFFGWRFIESATRSGQLVYKKKHGVTTQCAGASKGAHFYLLNYDPAKKLLSKFLPIS
jgi:hypothetical protein